MKKVAKTFTENRLNTEIFSQKNVSNNEENNKNTFTEKKLNTEILSHKQFLIMKNITKIPPGKIY